MNREGWCEMRHTAVNSDWHTTSFQRLHVAPPSPAAYELHRPNRKNNAISFCNVKQCFKRLFGIFFQICNIFNVLRVLISVLQFKHDKRKKSKRVGGEWCYGLKSQNISTQILFLQYYSTQSWMPSYTLQSRENLLYDASLCQIQSFLLGNYV